MATRHEIKHRQSAELKRYQERVKKQKFKKLRTPKDQLDEDLGNDIAAEARKAFDVNQQAEEPEEDDQTKLFKKFLREQAQQKQTVPLKPAHVPIEDVGEEEDEDEDEDERPEPANVLPKSHEYSFQLYTFFKEQGVKSRTASVLTLATSMLEVAAVLKKKL